MAYLYLSSILAGACVHVDISSPILAMNIEKSSVFIDISKLFVLQTTYYFTYFITLVSTHQKSHFMDEAF